MAKQILKGKELKNKLLSGIQQLAETVSITLGPKGRNVGLDMKFVEPIILHDGVSVARQIELPDPFENFAAKLIQQTSSKTADKAGDGTTTSTLLAWKIIENGFREIEENNMNPMTMKKGITLATNEIVEHLKKMTQEIKTPKEITQIATVSSANEELGKIIGEAVARVGKDGTVTVEESAKMDTVVEYKEGMEIDKGYISPYFCTNAEKMESEIKNPRIILTDMEITSPTDMGAVLETLVKELKREDIVIIATHVDGGALETLILNKNRGSIKPLAVFAPSFGLKRRDVLEDIAVLTGATVITREMGIKIDEIKAEHFGQADLILADAEKTKIIGGYGKPEKIEERVKLLRQQIKDEESDFAREKLQERLARLVSGAAIIKVGATTEIELSDKRERVIDAVEATKSALEEGIVPGGGIIYYQLYKKIKDLSHSNKDQQAGIDIVRNALLEPLKKILDNAGEDSTEIIKQIENNKESNFGYDVETEVFGNMFELGIIDPTKVVRNAIQNSASVSAQILTMEATVCVIPDETPPTLAPKA